jgi:hygromycin-B 7''-O-kinase
MLPAVRTDEDWQAVVWDEEIVRPAAEDLAARLGLAGAELRRATHPILGPPDWAGFLAGQRATARERQRETELPDGWLSQIEGFLESAPLAPDRERVLLHTEVTREHLVVNPVTWTLSGLLDFEQAMTGDRAYKFVTVGLLVSRCDPRLLGRILAAYGRSFDPRELLAYTLLHVHSNLTACLSELPAPPEPTLDSLALTWFGTT